MVAGTVLLRGAITPSTAPQNNRLSSAASSVQNTDRHELLNYSDADNASETFLFYP